MEQEPCHTSELGRPGLSLQGSLHPDAPVQGLLCLMEGYGERVPLCVHLIPAIEDGNIGLGHTKVNSNGGLICPHSYSSCIRRDRTRGTPECTAGGTCREAPALLPYLRGTSPTILLNSM